MGKMVTRGMTIQMKWPHSKVPHGMTVCSLGRCQKGQSQNQMGKMVTHGMTVQMKWPHPKVPHGTTVCSLGR